VAKNILQGVSVVGAKKEKKCRSAAAKLKDIVEHGNGRKKKHGKGKGKTVDGSSRKNSLKRKDEKQCRRIKKTLNRKCHHIGRCCSLANQCHGVAEHIDNQMRTLKREMKICKV